MKNIYSLALTVLISLGLMNACDNPKVLPVIDLSGVNFVSPLFSNAATGAGDLGFLIQDDEFENFAWSAAEYGQDLAVTYTLEMSGSNAFVDTYELAETEELSAALTVKEINDGALSLGLPPFEENNLVFRVTSVINGIDSTDLESSPITRTVSPYVTDFASAYMIGDAVKGWDWSKTVEIYGVGFKKYEVVAEFNDAGNFRFFENNDGDWGGPAFGWSDFNTVGPEFSDAGSDNNITFTGTTGYYRISADLVAKTLTMLEKLPAQPSLYIVGSGVPASGWGWDTPVDMEWVQDGVFRATTKLNNNDGVNEMAFRFFTGFGDWGSGQNYPHYEGLGYEIDVQLANAGDGDNNFMFTGTTDTYTITINDITKQIVISEPGAIIPVGDPKYLVGSAVPEAGWGWATPIELVQGELGVYTGTTRFIPQGTDPANNGEEAFRVFTAAGDWGSGINYPTFITDGYTIDADFANAADNDENFEFLGTDGTYTFILDDNLKTITIF